MTLSSRSVLRRSWLFFALAAVVVAGFFLSFGKSIVARGEYWLLLRSAYSGGYMPKQFYHSPPAYDLEKLPVIETSLSGYQQNRLVILIKSCGLRDHVLKRINAPPKTQKDIRVRSFLLHLLVRESPRGDLFTPLTESLESRDESVYGWACSDLNTLMQKGFLAQLDLEQLRCFQRLLSDDSYRRLEGSAFADAAILGENEFSQSRASALQAISERIRILEESDGQ